MKKNQQTFEYNVTHIIQKDSVEGVEVLGKVLTGYLEGMGNFKLAAYSFLAETGISTINENQWYPLKSLLEAFEEIIFQRGNFIFTNIGKELPHNALWPDNLTNFTDAVLSIDKAYHMNHRRNGQALFDFTKKQIIEGNIGHFNYFEREKEENCGYFISNTYYPCDLEFNMLKELLKNYKPGHSKKIQINHHNLYCRKEKNEFCIYQINWD